MAIVSSTNILRPLCLFHLTVAYFLLTNPSAIAQQNLVYILGASMNLPTPSVSFLSSSPSLALAALFLALLAISDLMATSSPLEVYSHYWSSQAPIRLLFFFAVTGGAFGLASRGEEDGFENDDLLEVGWREGLGNGVVFTWGFVEMMVWFWIFNTLREERKELAARTAERRKAQEDKLQDYGYNG